MKKILFIAPLDTKDRFRGGITSYGETIVNNQQFFNNNQVVFTPFNNCVINRKTGTNGRLSFSNFLNYLKSKKLLAKELKANKYDAIYLNTSYGISLLKDLMTIKRSYLKKYQVFLHIHFADLTSILTKQKIIRKLIEKQLKTKVTTIISLSKGLKDELINRGYSENSIDVLYNYFDPKLSLTDISKIKEKNATKKRKVVFLFVGSLDNRKGFYDLVEVFKQINSEKAKLIICGKPNDDKAQLLLDEIKDNDTFEYRGYVSGEQKNQAFKDADVFVLPSYGEGLPITILEAFRFGLPVISTNVGAIPEIINERLGTIIHPGNLGELRTTINKYIETDLLDLSLNCLKESEKYTFEKFSQNLLKIITKND